MKSELHLSLTVQNLRKIEAFADRHYLSMNGAVARLLDAGIEDLTLVSTKSLAQSLRR